jgi:hypothetical protein
MPKRKAARIVTFKWVHPTLAQVLKIARRRGASALYRNCDRVMPSMKLYLGRQKRFYHVSQQRLGAPCTNVRLKKEK